MLSVRYKNYLPSSYLHVIFYLQHFCSSLFTINFRYDLLSNLSRLVCKVSSDRNKAKNLHRVRTNKLASLYIQKVFGTSAATESAKIQVFRLRRTTLPQISRRAFLHDSQLTS